MRGKEVLNKLNFELPNSSPSGEFDKTERLGQGKKKFKNEPGSSQRASALIAHTLTSNFVFLFFHSLTFVVLSVCVCTFFQANGVWRLGKTKRGS